MSAMTSFFTDKCCHLASVHATSERMAMFCFVNLRVKYLKHEVNTFIFRRY